MVVVEAPTPARPIFYHPHVLYAHPKALFSSLGALGVLATESPLGLSVGLPSTDLRGVPKQPPGSSPLPHQPVFLPCPPCHLACMNSLPHHAGSLAEPRSDPTRVPARGISTLGALGSLTPPWVPSVARHGADVPSHRLSHG